MKPIFADALSGIADEWLALINFGTIAHVIFRMCDVTMISVFQFITHVLTFTVGSIVVMCFEILCLAFLIYVAFVILSITCSTSSTASMQPKGIKLHISPIELTGIYTVYYSSISLGC